MRKQPSLFTQFSIIRDNNELRFDGKTFDQVKDGKRLTSQLERVKKLMKDHQWRTLSHIHNVVGGSEAGISARLRDLRKLKFGVITN